MNKYILYISLTLLASLSFCSCSSDNEVVSNKKFKDTITVAVTPTFDCLPLIVAQETGISDSLEHHLVLQYHYAKADCDTALVGGSVSAIFSDCGRADYLKGRWTKNFLARRGKKAKVDSLSITSHENLPLFIYTNYKSRLNEAKQLVDKMIACDRQSVEFQLAQHVLDSVKLTGDKTFLIEMNNLKTRTFMLNNNTMDAAVLPEPQASLMKSIGHKRIFSAREYKGRTLGCMISTRKTSELKHIYNVACDEINKRGIHAYDSILVKRYGIKESELQAIKDFKFKKM